MRKHPRTARPADLGVFKTRILDCGVSLEQRAPDFLAHEVPNDYARHLKFEWGLFELGAMFAAFTTILTTLALMVGVVPI